MTRLLRKIKQVIQFLPHVWRHEDWDYGYIVSFNIFLLERLRTSVFDKGHHVVAKHDKRKLTTVIELLRRYDDDFSGEEWVRLYKKHHPEIDPYDIKRFNEPRSKAFIKDYKRMIERKNRIREEETQLLFKLIKSQSKKWWD
jgi:hypothetical protein